MLRAPGLTDSIRLQSNPVWLFSLPLQNVDPHFSIEFVSEKARQELLALLCSTRSKALALLERIPGRPRGNPQVTVHLRLYLVKTALSTCYAPLDGNHPAVTKHP